MAYQQKLLLISCLFISGIGILAGIREFHSSSADANLNALTNDLLYIASEAQKYYHKPKNLMGGGHSFAGLQAGEKDLRKLLVESQNENGTFEIIPSENDRCLTIRAIGKDDNDGDGQKLTIEITIYPDSVQTKIISY